jgi:hypothetical protein
MNKLFSIKLPKRIYFYSILLILNFLISFFLVFCGSKGEMDLDILILGILSYIINIIVGILAVLIYEKKARRRKFDNKVLLIVYFIILMFIIWLGCMAGFNISKVYYSINNKYQVTLKLQEKAEKYINNNDLEGCLKYASKEKFYQILRHSSKESLCYTPMALKKNNIFLCVDLRCQILVYEKIYRDHSLGIKLIDRSTDKHIQKICSVFIESKLTPSGTKHYYNQPYYDDCFDLLKTLK